MTTQLLRYAKLSAVAATALMMAASAPVFAQAKGAKTGEYKTEAEAKTACGADTVVWVNTKSKKYHFAGTSSYGKTKKGAYECEKQAQANGATAAKGEKHP